MADFAAVEFRATVAFLRDGVLHRVADGWFAFTAIAQREVAERALSVLSCCVNQMMRHQSFPCATTPRPMCSVRGFLPVLQA